MAKPSKPKKEGKLIGNKKDGKPLDPDGRPLPVRYPTKKKGKK